MYKIKIIIPICILKEDFYDQDISPTSITVSFVRMSKDLKIANIYFMPLGGKNKIETLENLNKKKFIFQNFLSKAKIQSKFTPKLSFFLDDTFDEAQKIKELLLNKNVLRDIKE